MYYNDVQCGSVCIEENIANFMTCLTIFITIRAVLNRGIEMHLLLQDLVFTFLPQI